MKILNERAQLLKRLCNGTLKNIRLNKSGKKPPANVKPFCPTSVLWELPGDQLILESFILYIWFHSLGIPVFLALPPPLGFRRPTLAPNLGGFNLATNEAASNFNQILKFNLKKMVNQMPFVEIFLSSRMPKNSLKLWGFKTSFGVESLGTSPTLTSKMVTLAPARWSLNIDQLAGEGFCRETEILNGMDTKNRCDIYIYMNKYIICWLLLPVAIYTKTYYINVAAVTNGKHICKHLKF